MKKWYYLILTVILLAGFTGCGKAAQKEVEPANGQDYFNAKILAVHDTYLEVECLDVITGAISEGTPVTVSLEVASSNEVPNLKVGDEIRVVFTGVLEIYPPKLATVWGIYALEERNEEVSAANTLEEKTAEVTPSPSLSDTKWGIRLSTADVTPTGMTLIITQSGGEVTGELQFGSDYYLEVLENDSWIKVPYRAEGNIAWTEEAYMLKKDSIIELEINWDFLYGNLSEGTYRICKSFMDFRGTANYDKEIYSADFIIEF